MCKVCINDVKENSLCFLLFAVSTVKHDKNTFTQLSMTEIPSHIWVKTYKTKVKEELHFWGFLFINFLFGFFQAAFISKDISEKDIVRLTWKPYKGYQGHVEFRYEHLNRTFVYKVSLFRLNKQCKSVLFIESKCCRLCNIHCLKDM